MHTEESLSIVSLKCCIHRIDYPCSQVLQCIKELSVRQNTKGASNSTTNFLRDDYFLRKPLKLYDIYDYLSNKNEICLPTMLIIGIVERLQCTMCISSILLVMLMYKTNYAHLYAVLVHLSILNIQWKETHKRQLWTEARFFCWDILLQL